MKDITKRNLLFLLGCIGIRSFFVYLAKTIKKDYLQWMGWIALLPAIGFLYIWWNNLRKSGPEVMGTRIWWNDLRPIHSALYFIFAVMAIYKQTNAYVPLLVDVIIGLVAFIGHRIGN